MPALIETETLRLRRPRTEDVSVVHSIHSDSRTLVHNPGDALSSRHEARDLVERWEAQWERFGFGYYTVCERARGKAIGFCGFKTVHVLGREALNLFCRLAPEVWGQGVASEAVEQVLRHAAVYLSSWPLVAKVRPPNVASRRILERKGFHLVPAHGAVGPDGYEHTYLANWPEPIETLQPVYQAMPPGLSTDRLWLTSVDEGDAGSAPHLLAERHGLDCDLGVASNRLSESPYEGGVWLYAVRRKGDQDILGYCGLLTGGASWDEPEMIYQKRASSDRHQIEAAEAVIAAARTTGRKRLWSTVEDGNHSWESALTEIGFEPDHVRYEPTHVQYWRLEL